MKLFTVFLILFAGNCAYQLMAVDPNWAVAIERSRFQGWALLTYGMLNWMWGKMDI